MSGKLCKDCGHWIGVNKYGLLPGCDIVKINGADGQPEHYCYVERALPWILAVLMGMCGKTGRFFVARRGDGI